MSVRIRLAKTGKTHQISYRIVAQDSHSKRDGKFLEIIGFYNPHIKADENLKIEKEKLQYWLSKGAQLTKGVAKLLTDSKNTKGQNTSQKDLQP